MLHGRHELHAPYPEYSGDRWAELWEERLEQNAPYLLTWLANQKDGGYWRPGSIRGRYHEIKASALLIGGWRDGYCNAPLRTSQHMTAPSKVLIGPWNHSGPDCDTLGPSLAREHLTLRWCDYWLKGIDNGIMDEPDINVYVQTFDAPDAYRTHTSGYWRTERTFPIPGGRTHRLDLGSDLTPDNPDMARDGNEEYEYRPSVGIAGGLWSAGVPFGLPSDQRVDEIYSANYTSGPLDEPLEIIGMGRAVVHVSSTAPVMAFVARLSDVAPDGASAQVTIGVLNGTRRSSLTDPEPMEPGGGLRAARGPRRHGMEIRARPQNPAIHKQRRLPQPVADAVPRDEPRVPGQRTRVTPGTAGCAHSGRPRR